MKLLTKNWVIRHEDGSFIAAGRYVQRFTREEAEGKLAWLKENDPRPGVYSVVSEDEIPEGFEKETILP